MLNSIKAVENHENGKKKKNISEIALFYRN